VKYKYYQKCEKRTKSRLSLVSLVWMSDSKHRCKYSIHANVYSTRIAQVLILTTKEQQIYGWERTRLYWVIAQFYTGCCLDSWTQANLARTCHSVSYVLLPSDGACQYWSGGNLALVPVPGENGWRAGWRTRRPRAPGQRLWSLTALRACTWRGWHPDGCC